MFQSLLLFMFDSPMQIMLVVGVVFLLFGSAKLPQFAKSLGQTRKAFKEGMREADDEERIETEKRQQMLSSTAVSGIAAPQISAVSDQEIMAEMRRRTAVKSE